MKRSDIVRLGEHDIATEDDGATDDVEIAHVVPHPEYDSELQLNDIAIVHLKHDIEFTGKLNIQFLYFFEKIFCNAEKISILSILFFFSFTIHSNR